MSLLNSLSEPTSREVHLPPEALGLVVTQPILQEGSATNMSVTTPASRTKNKED